ncbi:hypothetical protein Btru_043759 [Bulinus truncatus]|nr:hypothetical protein Btru_043759 [Bulinus truncatus]
MGFTGVILCLFVAMIASNHVTVEGQGVCDENPCLNGGQCIDLTYPGGAQEFKCSCPEGFKGLTCQKRFDPCAAEPCSNGGSCIPHGESYHCACTEGYQGRSCEVSKVARETCYDKPCGSNGLCTVVNDDIYCECYSGFRGPRCETSDEKEAEAKGDGEDDDGSTGERPKPEDKKTTETLIGLNGTVVALLLIILIIILILLFHCCRICMRRWSIESNRKVLEAKGQTPPPTPGFWEINTMLCYDCMCPFCLRCFGQTDTTTLVKAEEASLLAKDRLLERSTRTHFSDPKENPPPVVYAKDTTGSEFTAFEDPNDPRLQDDLSPPDLNDNKVKRNKNKNFKSRDNNKYSERKCRDKRIKSPQRKSPERPRHKKKRKQQAPESSEESDDSSDHDEDGDGSSVESEQNARAPRGSLPGFSKIASERRPRRLKRSSASKGAPPPERENRRAAQGKHSKRKSNRFSERVDVEQSYSANYDDADDQSSDNETGQENMGFKDDGYTSVSRLSESDAGGRCRDPQSMHVHSEAASTSYHARHARGQQLSRPRPIQWPEGLVPRLVPRGKLTHDAGSEGSSGEEQREDVEVGKYKQRCGHRYDPTGVEGSYGEYSVDHEYGEKTKNHFKRHGANQRTYEPVIRVRSGTGHGMLYGPRSQNSGPGYPMNSLAYVENGNTNPHYHDPQRSRHIRRLPYPPNRPPPTYYAATSS